MTGSVPVCADQGECTDFCKRGDPGAGARSKGQTVRALRLFMGLPESVEADGRLADRDPHRTDAVVECNLQHLATELRVTRER